MKKTCLSVLFLVLLISSAPCQDLIGINKDTAEEFVKRELKGFNLDNSTRQGNFNYLKFLNSSGTKTLIIFFSDKNISVKTRMVCDFSEYDLITEELNKNYTKIGNLSWEFSKDKVKYVIKLEEKEWYFVVNTMKKQ